MDHPASDDVSDSMLRRGGQVVKCFLWNARRTCLVLQPQRVFISHFTFAGASNLRSAHCDAYISRSIILQSQKGDHYPHFCLFLPFHRLLPLQIFMARSARMAAQSHIADDDGKIL